MLGPEKKEGHLPLSELIPGFEAGLLPIHKAASEIKGWLSPREVRFLSVLMTHPTATGRVVELGCYHGKSTVVLAKASDLATKETLISVDPIDPTPVLTNLDLFKVSEKVEFINKRSDEFWPTWEEPIRLFWNDGANDRETVAQDFESGLPWLQDGAIIAFHDILNRSGERIHVFIDKVLRSPHFAASGLVGSIGWSQYRKRAEDAVEYQPAKAKLQKKLERLRPFTDLNKPRGGLLRRYYYRSLRWFVPHSQKEIEYWMRHVAFPA